MDRSESSLLASERPLARSREWKLYIWETFEMSLKGEVDPAQIPSHWHWIMYPLIDLLGPELVYAVGLQALGYPPTLVDTQQEVDQVDAALIKYLECKT